MTSPTIRVLCVDDHTFLAEGLRTRLAMERDMTFVGWLKSATDLAGHIVHSRAHIVLLDIEMPGPDPFEVLADVHRRHPDVRTIMFSAYVRDHYIDAAVKGGAWGYVSKSDEPEKLIEVIRRVAAGEFMFSPKVLQRCTPRRMADRATRNPESKLALLTPREIQVLRMIAKGMTRLAIAQAMCRSPKTVDNHRASIMSKLDIHDRVELARYAISEGLVES